jgi:HlyD family secretion protein
LIAVAAVGWWRRSGGNAVAAPTFRTTTVQRGDVTQTVTGSGTLAALTNVDVGSQVSGNILALYADFNDVVKKGQLLVEIEPTTYEARLFQAEADLLSAQATLELRQLAVRRAKGLLEQKLVSQSEYDEAAVSLRQQEASAKKAEAAVKSARTDLERCKIYSPVDGVVLKRAVSVGQTVQSNYNVATLFTIARDLRQMEIEAAISEADIGGVEAGQAVTFTVDAFPGRSFQGKVRQIRNNSTIQNNVVTYPTIISVENADLKLRPGMTANIVIATARRTGVLRVPNAALRFKAPEGATVLPAADAGGGAPDFDKMPAEIRQRLLADFDKNGDGKLDADERKTMETTMRNRRAAMSAGGGGGFGPPAGGMGGPPPGVGGRGPGAGGGGQGGGPRTVASSGGGGAATQPVTVYVPTGQPNATGLVTGTLQATRVFLGVSDSANTEILSGLAEGAIVATGTVSAQAAAASTSGTNNLFSPPRPPGAAKK